jgi:ketosteroid isomerase-like protein
LEVRVKNQRVQAAARWTRQAATISILIGTLHCCSCVAIYAAASKPLPCSAPAYRQFDFWVGEWDVFEVGGSIAEARGNGSDEDRRAVSALDTQFQAAVKKNDVEGMSRILADDYILVTSSGRTQTKTDLLNEAREGKTTYERQEDTNQTVRLWGDTAVVTAKLLAKGTDGEKPFDVSL